jgi:aminopeptidase N
MNLYENLLNYKFNPQLLLETLNSLSTRERDPLILDLIFDYQSIIYWKFLNSSRREIQEEKIVPILWALFNKSGQKNKKAVFNQLVDISLSPESLKRIYQLWENSGDEFLKLSDNELMKIAYELMLKLPDRYEEIKEIQENRLKNADRISEFKFIAMALHPDSSIRRDFRLSLAEVENRERESWVITAVHYLNHPLRLENEAVQLGFYLELLPEIKETGDIFFPKRWLDAAFWGHSTEEAVVETMDFIDDNPNLQESLLLKIKQSADLLFRAVKISEM